MPIMVQFGEFLKKAYSQTVLPDRSVIVGQKLAENAKIQQFKYDILSNFQTMRRHFKTVLHQVPKPFHIS